MDVFASSTTTNAESVRNPRLPYGWRRAGPISLSLLLHYGKAWRSSSLRELDPSRSPQTLQYLCSSVLSTAGFQPAAAGTAAVRVPVATPSQAGAFAA